MLSHYHNEAPRLSNSSAELVNLGRRPLLIVCAYEGTLAPSSPSLSLEVAPPHRRARNALAALVGHPKHQVMILTGLRDSQVDNLLSLPPLGIIGLYGLQWPGSALPIPDWKSLDQISNQLLKIEGLRLEHKGWTLSAHLEENHPARLVKVIAQLNQVQLPAGWDMIGGDTTREYLPKGFGKAQALERLVGENPFHHPVYFAEDSTCEAAFEKLMALGGTAIKVGKGKTQAQVQLSGPGDVMDLLEVWAQLAI